MSLFSNYIASLAAFMGFFLCIHFLLHKKYTHTLCLGLAALSIALEITVCILQQKFPAVYFVSFGNLLLSAPLFYFFIKSLQKKLMSKHYLLLGFWLVDSLYKVYWLLQPATAQTRYLGSADFTAYMQVFDILSYVFFITLLVSALKQVKLCEQQTIITPCWLQNLVWVLLFLNSTWLLDDLLLMFFPHNTVSPVMPAVSALEVLTIMCWVGFKSLQNSFAVAADEEQEEEPMPVEETPLLPEEQEIYCKLDAFLRNTKSYTKPGLTLEWLSKELGIKYKSLTKAIHCHDHGHFYTYINHLRLEEFKTLLASDMGERLSLEGLAKQAGFGSKTTFYTFFKKVEGMTPREYQRKWMRNAS